MAENQNPVFTDDTLAGDGTVENPLAVKGGGGGAPGGALGDAQFNDGAGGFTNADGIFATCAAAINGSGDFALFAARFLELVANNAVIIQTQPGNVVQIQPTFAAGETQIGNSANAVRLKGAIVNIANLQTFANNAAAVAGGLLPGDAYLDGGDPNHLCIVV